MDALLPRAHARPCRADDHVSGRFDDGAAHDHVRPESYTGEIERTLTHLQPAAGAPLFVFNPLGVYPSEPPGAPLIYIGANHGNGFLNSGMLDTDPHTPNPASVRIIPAPSSAAPWSVIEAIRQ